VPGVGFAKVVRFGFPASVCLVLLLCCSPVSASPLFPRKEALRSLAHAAAAPHARYAPGELLVTYRRPSARASLARAVGARQLTWNPTLRVQQLRVRSLSRAAERLRRSPSVALVERNPLSVPDHVSCVGNPVCAIPNDPYFPRQWWLQNDTATVEPSAGAVFGADVAAPLAWRIAGGNPAVLVAIVDTGIDRSHPDVGPRVIGSATLVGNGGDVNDYVGHGTAIAGVIAAIPNNGVGVAGVAYNASLLNVKAQSDTEPEGITCAAAANGITYATNAGAYVINASFGSTVPCAAEQSAVDYAAGRGSLVIAAAGNDGSSVPNYPAAFSNALGVAATDNGDRMTGFSSWGASWVDLAAPGERIWTTLPVAGSTIGTEYGYVDGTSFSAPIVAGIAALIWPYVTDANHDGRRNDDVARQLVQFADAIPGTGTYWRYGRVNACRAAAAGADRCPPPPPAAAPVATPMPTPTPAPVAPVVPAMTLNDGRSYVRQAIGERFGATARRRAYLQHCRHLGPSRVVCDVSWTTARWQFWGSVTALYTLERGEVVWDQRLSIRRAGLSCVMRKGRTRCPSRRFTS
jgi:thermitase